MFAHNSYEMLQRPENPQYIEYIVSCIFEALEESGIEPRVLLAVGMLEIEGQVDTPTTSGLTGIMQAYMGSTFNPQDPKPSISTMIRDGARGNGKVTVCLANYINIYRNLWVALAIYDQGALGANFNNLSDPGSTGTGDYVYPLPTG